MEILLAFAPFATFAVASRFLGTTPSLLLGAIVSLILIGYGSVIKKQKPRILEVGTFILFCGLGLYAKLSFAQWPVLGVRLGVDGGLLLIVLFSMVIRQPFTLQYAREQVPQELWNKPEFVNSNFMLTGAWAAAFGAIVAADALMVFAPRIPVAVGMAITVAALLAATKYTSSFSKQERPPGRQR